MLSSFPSLLPRPPSLPPSLSRTRRRRAPRQAGHKLLAARHVLSVCARVPSHAWVELSEGGVYTRTFPLRICVRAHTYAHTRTYARAHSVSQTHLA